MPVFDDGASDSHSNHSQMEGHTDPFSVCTPKEVPKDEEESGFMTAVQLYNIMMDGQGGPFIHDKEYLLLLDTRSEEEYASMHVITAIKSTELENAFMSTPVKNYTYVVLYDGNGKSHSLKDSKLTLLQEKMKSEGVDCEILLDGFDSFKAKFPFLCTDRIIISELQREEAISTYPSIVIDDFLYQGSGCQATNEKITNDLKITHIVNICTEHPNAFPNDIKYLKLEFTDTSETDLTSAYNRVNKFITEAKKEDNARVLIHCNVGISRSSTVTIAYLMQAEHWTLKDAHDFLKTRRPAVRPNRGFLKQLSQYEESLFGKKFTDIDDIWL